MTCEKLKIAISLRLSLAQNYSEKRDALSRDWPIFIEKLGGIPLLVPNSIKNINDFLIEIKPDAIILSGGENLGENQERDTTESHLIKYGIENKLPIFGVCRGMQIMNHYFGGSVTTTNDKKHVGKSHNIQINDSRLDTSNEIIVNSYHDNVIHKTDLSPDFDILAENQNDKTIEALIHKKFPIVGVMWHPERDQNKFNLKLVESVLKNDF